MKFYIDLSCDKISGQQIMQRAFKSFCVDNKIYADKENADVLVYVQVSPTQSVDEWKRLKARGKKIVFIHHYLVEDIVEQVAIFKNEDLLSQIDLHIIMNKESYIYEYLKRKGFSDNQIRICEQAGTNREELEEKYFLRSRPLKSICYVGRRKKGLAQFIDLTENLKDSWTVTIFCPDIEKYEGKIPWGFNVVSNLSGEALYENIAKHSFVYSPYIYAQSKGHLETIIHEANACGLIIATDFGFNNVVPHFERKGFARDFWSFDEEDYRLAKNTCKDFLHQNYKSLDDILKTNISIISKFVNKVSLND